MGVEEPHLRDGGRAHEAGVFMETGKATMQQQQECSAKWIGDFLLFGRHARPWSRIICAVDRHPSFHGFQIFEQHTAVNREIADH